MQKHSRLSISNLKKSNHVEGAFVGAGLEFNVHSLVIVYGSEKGRNLEVKTAVVVTHTHTHTWRCIGIRGLLIHPS